MIKIKNREKPPEEWLNKTKLALDEIKNAKESNIDIEIEKHYTDIKDLLVNSQNNHCCYCQHPIPAKYNDVEHFRPQKAPANSKDHPGYWWLVYEYRNLMFACPECNRSNKQHNFPINAANWDQDYQEYFNDSDNYMNTIDQKEQPLLINPLEDDPEEYFAYIWNVPKLVSIISTKKDPDRSKVSIRQLKLDREFLKIQRGKLLYRIQSIATRMKKALIINDLEEIQIAANDIKNETSQNMPYSGFVRYYFIKNNLEQYISN